MRLQLLVPLVLATGAGLAFAADPEPASPPQSVSVSASAPEPELARFTCHQESDLGSMRMHKVCTKVPTEAERVQVQDAVRNGLPNNSLTHPAVGDPTFRLMGQTPRH
jgi:hypothetical protein